MQALAIFGAAIVAAVWVGIPITLWMFSTKMGIMFIFAAIISTLVAWGFCWLALCQLCIEKKKGG